jgi:hypothetical protein
MRASRSIKQELIAHVAYASSSGLLALANLLLKAAI